MPCPHQKHQVLLHQRLDAPNFDAGESTAPLQPYRVEPDLSHEFLALHVYMERLAAIRRVEQEPVWPHSKSCRQLSVYMVEALRCLPATRLPLPPVRSRVKGEPPCRQD